MFLCETELKQPDYWFDKTDDDTVNKAFALTFRQYFYETALFYYNVVVDLTWSMTYTAIEYACTLNGKRVDLQGIKPLDEAAELLRKAEKNVTTPTAEENPFDYLNYMAPEFSDVISLIVDFWKSFGSSEVRQRYNYCKHKGKPLCNELEALDNSRFFSMHVESGGNVYEMAMCSKDIRYKISLEESIKELKRFDDEVLFPYVKELLDRIEAVIMPSPMAT